MLSTNGSSASSQALHTCQDQINGDLSRLIHSHITIGESRANEVTPAELAAWTKFFTENYERFCAAWCQGNTAPQGWAALRKELEEALQGLFQIPRIRDIDRRYFADAVILLVDNPPYCRMDEKLGADDQLVVERKVAESIYCSALFLLVSHQKQPGTGYEKVLTALRAAAADSVNGAITGCYEEGEICYAGTVDPRPRGPLTSRDPENGTRGPACAQGGNLVDANRRNGVASSVPSDDSVKSFAELIERFAVLKQEGSGCAVERQKP